MYVRAGAGACECVIVWAWGLGWDGAFERQNCAGKMQCERRQVLGVQGLT